MGWTGVCRLGALKINGGPPAFFFFLVSTSVWKRAFGLFSSYLMPLNLRLPFMTFLFFGGPVKKIPWLDPNFPTLKESRKFRVPTCPYMVRTARIFEGLSMSGPCEA
jgi:hypothetical protein